MKYFIAILALAAVAAAQQEPIPIVRQAQDIQPEGSYQYNYETGNGIAAAEQGTVKAANNEEGAAISAQGQYQYTAPDGTPVSVQYIADENGFQPQGAHLPVAPAVPEQIQRAIAYILAHPQPENQQ